MGRVCLPMSVKRTAIREWQVLCQSGIIISVLQSELLLLLLFVLGSRLTLLERVCDVFRSLVGLP